MRLRVQEKIIGKTKADLKPERAANPLSCDRIKAAFLEEGVWGGGTFFLRKETVHAVIKEKSGFEARKGRESAFFATGKKRLS